MIPESQLACIGSNCPTLSRKHFSTAELTSIDEAKNKRFAKSTSSSHRKQKGQSED
jgi:hypothetical protein